MASNLMSKLILRGLPYLLTYPPIWGSFLNEKIKVTSPHLNTKLWDQLQTDPRAFENALEFLKPGFPKIAEAVCNWI